MSHILVFIGKQGSGKSSLARRLSEHFEIPISMYSQPLRNTLQTFGIEQTRENLSQLSTVLRTTFGQDILERAIEAQFELSGKRICILDGVRRKADIANLCKKYSIILIAVDVPVEERYQRIIHRGQNTGEQQQSFDNFLLADSAESESQIDALFQEAHLRISGIHSFASTFSQLLEQLEARDKEFVKDLKL